MRFEIISRLDIERFLVSSNIQIAALYGKVTAINFTISYVMIEVLICYTILLIFVLQIRKSESLLQKRCSIYESIAVCNLLVRWKTRNVCSAYNIVKPGNWELSQMGLS